MVGVQLAARECTMIDWDDVRYFLAAAREGSVRAAAKRLAVNHATVLRRIAQLEQRLGAQMFEKLPSGYRLTTGGEEVLEFVLQMESSSHQLETRVFGRDQSVRGLLRVTLTPILATHLLLPDFADFARRHPDIEMEIQSSGDLANLTNREADVAIRVVYDRKPLPLNLHGLKAPELFGGVYIAAIGSTHGARARPPPSAGSSSARTVFLIGRVRAMSAPPQFPSGLQTQQRRSPPSGRGSG
jgi:DNA-binding transcriptional LysR family regulator